MLLYIVSSLFPAYLSVIMLNITRTDALLSLLSHQPHVYVCKLRLLEALPDMKIPYTDSGTFYQKIQIQKKKISFVQKHPDHFSLCGFRLH